MANVSMIRVQSLSGALLAEVSSVPETIALLKEHVCAVCGLQPGLVRLVQGDRFFADDDSLRELLGASQSLDLTLLVDESPLFTWDHHGNPQKDLLAVEAIGEGSVVTFVDGHYDYVNIITEQPVMRGVHYFEFIMHAIGDEQWCGVTASPTRAGYPGSLDGWFYYCGRRSSQRGALHAPGERSEVMKFKKVDCGDVIGTLVDLNRGALVFLLNGEMQGGCALPTTVPLYLTTCVDFDDDKVELRKPPLATVPAEVLEFAACGEFCNVPEPGPNIHW